MRHDPISDDYDADNPANAWQNQRDAEAAIGEEIERRKDGEIIND